MNLSFFFPWLRRHDVPAPATIQDQTDSGESETQFRMGLALAGQQGEAQDYVQAAEWYAKAAEQDHPLAQFNLAVMYAQGQGVTRDEAKSTMWLRRAAELGDAGAQYMLGAQQYMACRNRLAEAPPEARIEALKWVQLSAAQGYRGAGSACEFVALAMTLDEVAEGGRRAAAFTAAKGA